MAKFVIKKSSNSQFYFVLKADNGQVLVTSETYLSKDGAQNGISAVRQVAPAAKVEDESTTK